MDKKRTIIISSGLLLFTLFILLFRVGSLSSKIDEQGSLIKRMQKNLGVAVREISKKSSQTGEVENDLTAEFMYQFTSFNKEIGQAKAKFNLVPKEIVDGLQVSLVSSGNIINLNRDSVIFQGTHRYNLNDVFLNLVTYRNGKKVQVEKFKNNKYHLRVGDLIIPKIKVEKKSFEKDHTPGKYKISSVMKFKLQDALSIVESKSVGKTIGFQSLEVKLDINGENVQTEALEISKAGFSDEFNDISFERDIKDTDTVKLYLEALDQHGLKHRSYLDILNGGEFTKLDSFKVMNSSGQEVIFEY